MQKTCSKCQTPFSCKNEAPGCWCESLHLTAETLAHLKQKYDNCLCTSCLQQYCNLSSTYEKNKKSKA